MPKLTDISREPHLFDLSESCVNSVVSFRLLDVSGTLGKEGEELLTVMVRVQFTVAQGGDTQRQGEG